jgi:hypothetical protein
MGYPFTFGIITNAGTTDELDRLDQCIASVIRESELTDDIIVIGGARAPKTKTVTWIPFNENIKPNWITRKKNIIAEVAKTDAICFMHDYVSLVPGWREGYNEFSVNDRPGWMTMTNRILNADGKRFRDWCVIYNDAWMNPPIDDQVPPENIEGHLLQYDNHNLPRWQYYSGAYFCAHKSIMMTVPLNEERVWGQGEDVEWCRRVFKFYGNNCFSFNQKSVVKLLKQKQSAPWEAFSPL